MYCSFNDIHSLLYALRISAAVLLRAVSAVPVYDLPAVNVHAAASGISKEYAFKYVLQFVTFTLLRAVGARVAREQLRLFPDPFGDTFEDLASAIVDDQKVCDGMEYLFLATTFIL